MTFDEWLKTPSAQMILYALTAVALIFMGYAWHFALHSLAVEQQCNAFIVDNYINVSQEECAARCYAVSVPGKEPPVVDVFNGSEADIGKLDYKLFN